MIKTNEIINVNLKVENDSWNSWEKDVSHKIILNKQEILISA